MLILKGYRRSVVMQYGKQLFAVWAKWGLEDGGNAGVDLGDFGGVFRMG